jgi:hypothetical protein
MPRNAYQGGFSDKVAQSHTFRKYVEGNPCVCGWLGESCRTKARDALLESALRLQGLKEDGVALWLTSGTGRHLGDNVDRSTPIEEFKKNVLGYTSGAFIDVTIWSHPDHAGSLASSSEIRNTLKKQFCAATE